MTGISSRLLRTSDEDPEVAGIDEKCHALVRVAGLIAVNATPPAYMNAVEAALRAGLSNEQIVGTLIALLPTIGVPSAVSAAPNLGLALGYDVHEGLELLDEPAR